MSREASLAKNTLILALGTFLPRAISLITSPIITLCTEGQDYGYINLLTSTVLSFVVPIATLQLEQAFFRFLIRAETEDEKKNILSSGMVVVFGIMILVVIGCVYLPFLELKGFELVLLIAYICIEMTCQILRYILRAFSMYKEYSLLATIVVIVNFVTLVTCLVIFKTGYIGVLIALALADIVGICYSSTKTRIFSYLSIRHCTFAKTKELLCYSFPFIPNSIAGYINVLSDQWIVTAVLGLTANGVYTIAMKVPSILSLIYPTFNLAWTESVLNSYDDEDSSEYYGKMFKMMYCLLSSGTACLIAGSPILFSLLNKNPQLDDGIYYTSILVLGTYFTCFSQFFSGIYIALKKSKDLMYSTGLAALVNVILNLIFVQFFGIIAAVVATVISNSILAGYRYRDINTNYYRMKVPRRIVILTIVVFIITVALSLQGSWYAIVLNMFIAGVFSYIVAGDILKVMFKSVLNKIKVKRHS